MQMQKNPKQKVRKPYCIESKLIIIQNNQNEYFARLHASLTLEYMQRSFSTVDEWRKAIFLPHTAEKCDKIQPFDNRNSVNEEYM